MSEQSDSILRLPAVLQRTGLTRSTVYRKIAEGSFPQQVRLNTRCAGWYASEVAVWMATLRQNSRPS